MSLSIADSGIRLAVLCIVMALVATLVYRFTSLGSVRVVPGALARGALQLAAISLILAAALAHIWSALLVLVGMFAAASFTAARRCGAGTSGAWLTIALASGIGVVLPLMLLSGVVPLEGVALVPIGGIVLGGAMTATSMAAKRGLDAVDDRYGGTEPWIFPARCTVGNSPHRCLRRPATGSRPDAHRRPRDIARRFCRRFARDGVGRSSRCRANSCAGRAAVGANLLGRRGVGTRRPRFRLSR